MSKVVKFLDEELASFLYIGLDSIILFYLESKFLVQDFSKLYITAENSFKLSVVASAPMTVSYEY